MERPDELGLDWIVERSQLADAASLRLFEQKGVLQIRNFLNREKIPALFDATLAANSALDSHDKALKVGTGRHMLPLPISDVFDDPDIYAQPELHRFLTRLYGKNFVLNCFTCVDAEPGADDQHIHRDYEGLFADKIDSFCPSFAVNLFIPLVPFNSVNGTTRVWPGSHRKPDLSEDPLEGGFLDPELKPGSALLVDYRLKHCGTANRSKTDRPALCLGYSRDWFLDTLHYKNINPLQIDRKSLASKPDKLRQLLSRAAMYENQAADG